MMIDILVYVELSKGIKASAHDVDTSTKGVIRENRQEVCGSEDSVKMSHGCDRLTSRKMVQLNNIHPSDITGHIFHVRESVHQHTVFQPIVSE